MILYFVRHGETNHNKNCIIQGNLPTVLNEEGINQIREAAKLFKGKNIEEIIYSPLRRTKQSAEILQEEIGCGKYSDGRLVERSFGNLKGKPDEEYLKDIDLYWDEDKDYSDENFVEPYSVLKNRIEDFMFEIKRKYDNRKSFIVVTHGSDIAMALRIVGENRSELDIHNGEVLKVVI